MLAARLMDRNSAADRWSDKVKADVARIKQQTANESSRDE